MSASDFFSKATQPERFEEKQAQIKEFVSKHNSIGHRVVLISSGGTTVPLESRTVRFIDNFSVGTRGSASAEYFLKSNYAVVFLHRLRSLEPFSRHLDRCIIGMLEVKGDTISVKAQHTPALKDLLQQYQGVQDEDMLLQVDFTSLAEYLHLLRASAQLLHPLGSRALLYLAAAVSDFYIPRNELPEHKIQSSTNTPLQLSLQLVPKMLQPLVKEWSPNAFVVSFKLETDKSLMIKKAHTALEQYEHQIVIANLLETRKNEVVLVTRTSEQHIKLSQEERSKGIEIEQKIVTELVKCHMDFCA